jgi:hypothetical protein
MHSIGADTRQCAIGYRDQMYMSVARPCCWPDAEDLSPIVEYQRQKYQE